MELVTDDELPDPPVRTPPPSQHWPLLTPAQVEAYCAHCVQADEIRWSIQA